MAEISWSKNIVIIEKCKDPLEREFYIKMTKRYGWTKDALVNNIENKAFEKYLLNQTNFDKTVPEKLDHRQNLSLKMITILISWKWALNIVKPSLKQAHKQHQSIFNREEAILVL